MSGTGEKNLSIVCEVLLPSENHKLHCWKVRDGSSVRSGETVALAVLKSVPITHTNGNSSVEKSVAGIDTAATVQPPQYKRATRRRRPEAVLADSIREGSPDLVKAPAFEKDRKNGPLTTSSLVPIVARGDGILRIPPSNGDNKLSIGCIEECIHPTVIEGLCAVCGRPIQARDLNRQGVNLQPTANSMSHVTVGGLTVSISRLEGQRMAQQDAERLRQQLKLSLVLDLDHTLVHATNDLRARQHLGRADVRSLILPIVEQRAQLGPAQQHMWMQHFVKLRPYVKEFLQTALELFEVGVYTAGTRDYAEQITIMLARHLVDAPRDQVELQELRFRVARAEGALKRVNDTKVKAETSIPEKEDIDEVVERANEATESSLAGMKRKRVTFGEVPTTQKSDQITAEEVAELLAELREAEKLETKAQEMRQRLFGSRVVSRTDVGDLGRDVKSLKRIFPCGGTMAVVVDDREDVWANASDVASSRKGEPPENLLLVRPYHWGPFIGYADVNNAAGSDLSATDSEEVERGGDKDEQLRWTCDILKRLHQRFYSTEVQSYLSVADILRQMRLEVLSGGRIVLSGLVPLHRQNIGADHPRPPVVRYVECLGAAILPNVTSSTTHVVAAKDGTDKILNARNVSGCFVVKASWLMECLWSLTKCDERSHLLSSVQISGEVRPLGISRLGNVSTSSDDDDDDDLAAEFESDFLED
jgi:RNA polymerase II subunit A C-terminal domain phosphatase